MLQHQIDSITSINQFHQKRFKKQKSFDRSQLDVPNQRFRMLNLHSHKTPGLILRLPQDSEISGYGLSDLLAWAAKAFDGLQYPKP
jgi:Tfp pilus assembly pilus retraction ATPase PilT